MPIVLTQEIKDLVNSGLVSGNPLLLAAVSSDQRPILSFRGSTQVFSDDQLGLWVRNATGSTLEAIKGNPNVALMFRSATVPLMQFVGRARIASDEAERSKVYESAPEYERKADSERKGVAIIIDLDRVEGAFLRGAGVPPDRVKLERSA